MVDPPRWPLGDHPDGWPTVSVVMPVRNEAAGLEAAVESVLSQGYPRPFDVCLAVGPSEDSTRAIADRLAAEHPQVTVVDNPAGTTPAGLNAAIRATDGGVVVRVDGHARLCEGYIRRAVETMAATGAVNVGGIQAAVGETPFEEAVAAAQSSWLGTGGSRFRVGGKPGPVDTVYLGVFRREAIEAVGLFDERLIRNQDYELNIRLRKSGGTIWFDPDLSASYRPRGTLRALTKQYYEYGWWKAEVARIHPSSLRPRQLGPALASLLLVLVVVRVPVRAARLATVLLVALSLVRRFPTVWLPLVVPMHLGWSVGFWSAVLSRCQLQHDVRELASEVPQ